jgi:large subunit ribosomal protein L32
MISVWHASAGMAVPKKKTSKGKRNQRHAHWKAKAGEAARKAMSIGKSVLSGRAQGFIYPVAEEAESEEA